MSLTSLRRKLPVPLRQSWKPVTAGVVGLVVAMVFFGDVVIRPYSTSASTATEATVTENVVGTVDLFDGDIAHEITLTYSQADYDRMLDTYFTEGEKEWMRADITIDGTRVDDVAVRLKGNSTLSSLVDEREGSSTQGERAPGGIGGGEGRMPEGLELPEGGEMPEGLAPPDGAQMPEGFTLPDGARPPGADGQAGGLAGGGFGGLGGTLSTEQPETLPLLVSFDEYRSGRAYQGLTDVSIRPAGTYRSSLNEAVALELTALSGQPSQRFSYSTYTVNDRPTATRLVLEVPGATYDDTLSDSGGVVYKMLSTASFSYQGQDQTEYQDDFSQVNLVGSQDLQPLISFLQWLDSASDEEFADELGDWLDVDSFARYLGTQEVLANSDGFDGAGRNAYLFYDFGTGLISIVSWDLNMALGGMGGRGGGFEGAPGGGPPTGGDFPAPDQGQGGGPDFGGLGGSSTLVTKFEASSGFAALVDAAVADLTATWIDSGRALDVLDDVAARVPVTEGLDQATIDSDVASLRTMLTPAQ